MSITSTVVHRAETRFIEAAGALRPYVGCFWVITAERGAMIRVVPDGTTSISIQLQNERSSAWVLRGPLVEPQVRRFAAPATLIGIRLRPGVAFLVSGIPADAMVGRRISLRGRAYGALACEVCPSRTPEQHIELLERFLIERLASANRSEEHTSELQSLRHLVCRLLLEKKNKSHKSVRGRRLRLPLRGRSERRAVLDQRSEGEGRRARRPGSGRPRRCSSV